MTLYIDLHLHMANFGNTQAYAPILPDLAYHANIGGPALGVAGTPRKRGPLPPLTRGRGRLPNFWTSPLTGAGPKLSWHNVGTRCRNLLTTARRAGARIAMVRLVMAVAGPSMTRRRGSPSLGTPCALMLRASRARRDHPPGGAIIIYIILVPPRIANPTWYLDADLRGNFILEGIGFVSLPNTPLHTRGSFVVLRFEALFVCRATGPVGPSMPGSAIISVSDIARRTNMITITINIGTAGMMNESTSTDTASAASLAANRTRIAREPRNLPDAGTPLKPTWEEQRGARRRGNPLAGGSSWTSFAANFINVLSGTVAIGIEKFFSKNRVIGIRLTLISIRTGEREGVGRQDGTRWVRRRRL